MAKEKTTYVCSACGYETPRWLGKCPGCNTWNTLEEQAPQASSALPVKANKQRGGTGATALRLDEIPEENSAQFDISDTRTLDEVVNWLLELGHLPSFCTACYR